MDISKKQVKLVIVTLTFLVLGSALVTVPIAKSFPIFIAVVLCYFGLWLAFAGLVGEGDKRAYNVFTAIATVVLIAHISAGSFPSEALAVSLAIGTAVVDTVVALASQ